jgi:hypothetical protein
MSPPIPHFHFFEIIRLNLSALCVLCGESQCFLCKTNPISQLPKSDLTPYPLITNDERPATSDDKNKPNSNPIKANIGPKTQAQTQKQTQNKAKLRQFRQSGKTQFVQADKTFRSDDLRKFSPAVPYYLGLLRCRAEVEKNLLKTEFCSVFVWVIRAGEPIEIFAGETKFEQRNAMKRNTNIHRIDPVCRFGPGGDFIQTWPCNPEDYLQHSQSPLTKLLCSISKLISSTEQAQAAQTNSKARDRNGESQNGCNAATVTDSKDDNDVCGQVLLFADDSRNRRAAQYKPKHRIRTYSRTAKKRPALRLASQGSLFKADAQSVKTA